MPTAKPVRPQARDHADRFVAWLAPKPLWWFLAIPIFGGLISALLALPYRPPWHELLAWTLLGISVSIAPLALTAVTAIRGRSLVTEAHDLADLCVISWTQFEELVAALFRQRQWQVILTQAGADGGADLVIKKPGQRGLVQCKQWRRDVGVDTVRAFYGAMAANGVTKGYFVTTSEFTSEAARFAHSVGLETISGTQLVRHLKRIKLETATPGSRQSGTRRSSVHASETLP